MNDKPQFPVPPGTAFFFERGDHFAGFKVIEKQLEPAGVSG
jgi:hypothetical protein